MHRFVLFVLITLLSFKPVQAGPGGRAGVGSPNFWVENFDLDDKSGQCTFTVSIEGSRTELSLRVGDELGFASFDGLWHKLVCSSTVGPQYIVQLPGAFGRVVTEGENL